MIKLSQFRRDIDSDENGATLVEFAFVAGPLILLLLGIIDLGYRGYVDTVAKSQLHEIAREASTGGLSVAQIEQRAEDRLDPVLMNSARVEVEVESYFDFTNIGKPEKISVDNNANGMLDSGDCYLDGNGNDTFDTDYGRSGTGGPDDIVSYTITVVSPRLFPLAGMFGSDQDMVVTNSTAVRNQPYGAQNPIPEVCEP